MKALGVVLVTVLLALPAMAQSAGSLPPTGTSVYSNACSSSGGDWAGYRVTVTRGPGTLRAVVEFNDSGPDGRDTARGIKFDPLSGKLIFSFRGDLPHSFEGIISRESLIGTFDGTTEKLALVKKVPKYLSDCDPAHP